MKNYIICSTLLTIFGAFGVVSQATAQAVVLPGTDEFFGPDTVDGSFSSTSDDCDAPTNLCSTSASISEAEAYTYTASIFNTTQSSTTVSGLFKEFTIPSLDGKETVLDARLTGGASWRGSFYVVDFTKIAFFEIPSLGAKAQGFVRVSLVDVTDRDEPFVVDPFDMGNDAIEDFGCEPDRGIGGKVPLPLVSDGVELGAEVGWCEEERAETFNVGAKVITGHTYQIQLSMVCQSTTGVPLTFASVCTFNDGPELNLSMLLTDALDDLNIVDLEVDLGSIHLGMINVPLPGFIVDILDAFGDDTTSININLGSISLPSFELPLDDIVNGFLTPVLGAILDAAAPRIDSGFLHWDYMNVTIDSDLVSLVDGVEASILNQVDTSEANMIAAVDIVGEAVEVVRTGVADSLRLMHTPPGRRESGPIPGFEDLCGDGTCMWDEQSFSLLPILTPLSRN